MTSELSERVENARRHARGCLDRASKARGLPRELLRTLAQTWSQLADQLEQSLVQEPHILS
jgi:hypothetical protein